MKTAADARQALMVERQRLVAESARVRRSTALTMVALTVVVVLGGAFIALLVRSEQTLGRLNALAESYAVTIEAIAYRSNFLLDEHYRTTVPTELISSYQGDFVVLINKEQQLSASIESTLVEARHPIVRRFGFVQLGELNEFGRTSVNPKLLAVARGVPSRLLTNPSAPLTAEEIELRHSISNGEFVRPSGEREQLIQAVVVEGHRQFRRALSFILTAIILGLASAWTMAFWPSLCALRSLTAALDAHATELEHGYVQIATAQRVARLGYWFKSGQDEISCSAQIVDMLGLPAQGAPTALVDLAGVGNSGDRPAPLAVYEELAKAPGSAEFSRSIIRANHEVRTIRERVESYRSGDTIEMTGVMLDISELAEAQQLMTRMEKFEIIDLLISGIAHDFNNQLGIVLGNAELALLAPGDHSRQMRAIITACETASALIGQLRQTVMDPSVMAETFRPAQAIQQLVDAMAPVTSAEAAVEVVTEISGHGAAAAVWVNQGLFESAIVNLLSNALDALAGAPGRIVITVGVDRDLPTETPGSLNRRDHDTVVNLGPWVTVSVTDNGSGMSDDVLRRAFQPFFTTKNSETNKKNMGLGLWSVYAFVKAWNGGIEIDSAEGQGTTVWLRFPAVATNGEPAHDTTSDGIDLGGVALLVEDIAELRDTVAAGMQRLGMSVLACSTLAEAERQAARADLRLLITDLGLGVGTSGFDVARVALERHPNLGIVFISGSLVVGEIPRSIPRSQCTFLAKPFSADELEQAIRRVVQRTPSVSTR